MHTYVCVCKNIFVSAHVQTYWYIRTHTHTDICTDRQIEIIYLTISVYYCHVIIILTDKPMKRN